jgi:DNA helicase-2/ATP-dependent DNA helicase PcrA
LASHAFWGSIVTPNPQQLEVINHIDGPCLVTAVPGSGKTTALTERIKRLVGMGKAPSSILAITFTKKAANEMRTRISAAVGQEAASQMTICTFHSLCAKLLRASPATVGLTRDFTIYDDDGQERALKAAIAKVEGEDFRPKDDYWYGVKGYIEGKRNACLTDEQAIGKYGVDVRQQKVASEYFTALVESNAIDFTGLLSEANRMLMAAPDLLAKCRERFRYISVDEVQDTNVAQYELVKLLGLAHRNVLVVGDLQQSIYAFRNASPQNIIRFRDEFVATIIKLEKNYRSTPEILRHAQYLIENNDLKIGTTLRTDNASGPPPSVRAGRDEAEMAGMLVETARQHMLSGVPAREVVVLYRTNFMSRSLEVAFRAQGVKCRVVGGTSFFDRKEVKAAISVLQLMSNPGDRVSFERAVEACCRGVGEKALAVIAGNARVMGLARAASDFAAGTGRSAMALRSFTAELESSASLPAMQRLLRVCQATCLWERMERESTPGNDRCANIEELAADAGRWVDGGGTLSGYLQNLSLMASGDDEGEQDEVRLMTMHACKGLEFDVVLMSHCCQNMVPYRKVVDIEDPIKREAQMEEERRLFYVAMTRARKILKLFFCRQKRTTKGVEDFQPSDFLYEARLAIPPAY